MVHWLIGSLITGSLAHDISLDSLFLVFSFSRFFDFWIFGHLVNWRSWLCSALAGSANSGSFVVQNDVSYPFGIENTPNFAVLPEKPWFFTNKILPLLTMYPPRLDKLDCNLAPMSLLKVSISTFLDHTDSLCVIGNIAPMQANFDMQSC